ncbi:MAG TPA: RNA polymerase sigma factor [Bryobacteraceae bacterium]
MTGMEDEGKFEARYLAFLETISHVRPRLHRYCARMTGSITDGEDVVQDALFRAYRSVETWDESRPLVPWLFRIAHNQCIDFLRSRGVRVEAEAAAAEPDFFEPAEPRPAVGPAIEHLVLNLPPKERACVLLKDVFEYSLEEIADLVDTTVGGVKAALSRGRSKLAALENQPERAGGAVVRDSKKRSRIPTPGNEAHRRKSVVRVENKEILRLYVERFNSRDWDGLRELISADARLLVADRFAGKLADAGYFGVYARMKQTWRLALGEVDGEPSVILLNQRDGSWEIEGIVRLDIAPGGRIAHISDYQHCPWTLTAGSIVVREPVV